MTNFVLLGAAGYVAPRHMAAIKAVGGNLIAAIDPHDSVGILDSYFPECQFFTEFERFDRFCDKWLREDREIDYAVVATPNYLHDAHCRWALRLGIDAICEKPPVVHEHNLNALRNLEDDTLHKVFCVYQLRCHNEIKRIKDSLSKSEIKRHGVSISYNVGRGSWYNASWKGNEAKSGGLLYNIGCHLFDIATCLFGNVIESDIDLKMLPIAVSGKMQLERADVLWKLGIHSWGYFFDNPERQFIIDGEKLNLSNGASDLHTEVYKSILNGEGIRLEDIRQSIRAMETAYFTHMDAD